MVRGCPPESRLQVARESAKVARERCRGLGSGWCSGRLRSECVQEVETAGPVDGLDVGGESVSQGSSHDCPLADLWGC